MIATCFDRQQLNKPLAKPELSTNDKTGAKSQGSTGSCKLQDELIF
jgi:hypothetical protein